MEIFGLLGFLVTILVVIVVGVIIYGLRQIYGEKDDARNEEIVINFLSDYTQGHGLLLVKEKESNKDLIHITGLPRDIDYIKIKDEDFVIKEQDLFVRKDLYIPIGNSAHRTIKLALPDKAEHLPEEVKKTVLGKLLGEFIENRNAEKDKLEVKDLRSKNLLDMTKKTDGLEMAQEISGLSLDFVKDIVKSKTPPEPPKKEW